MEGWNDGVMEIWKDKIMEQILLVFFYFSRCSMIFRDSVYLRFAWFFSFFPKTKSNVILCVSYTGVCHYKLWIKWPRVCHHNGATLSSFHIGWVCFSFSHCWLDIYHHGIIVGPSWPHVKRCRASGRFQLDAGAESWQATNARNSIESVVN